MKNFTFVVLLGATLSGCGSASQPPVPVYPVSGVITLQGQPVIGADVTFVNAEKNRSAFGRTNEKGEYRLTTFTSNDGAVEGKVVVTVTKAPETPNNVAVADIDSEAYVPPSVEVRRQSPAKTKKEKPLLPERYSTPTSSSLMAMISSDQENKLNFDLEM